MSDATGIRWTEHTWNPTRGCAVVSPGCSNCYAMRVAYRFSGAGRPYEGLAEKRNGHPVWTGRIRLVPEKLAEPARWQRQAERTGRPVRVFVDSMSDAFHPDIPDEYLDRMFDVMEACPLVTFQILTKRPERMRDYMRRRALRDLFAHCGPVSLGAAAIGRRYATDHPNLWLGVSVEDGRRAAERIPLLLDTPAAVRFLSLEPLLGPIDLEPAGGLRVDWVIVGGESGPDYRPMELDWARSLRDQCRRAGIPFFFKQQSGLYTERGQELDGVRWEEFPATCRAV